MNVSMNFNKRFTCDFSMCRSESPFAPCVSSRRAALSLVVPPLFQGSCTSIAVPKSNANPEVDAVFARLARR